MKKFSKLQLLSTLLALIILIFVLLLFSQMKSLKTEFEIIENNLIESTQENKSTISDLEKQLSSIKENAILTINNNADNTKTEPVIVTFDNKDYIIAQKEIVDDECEICGENFTDITQSPNKQFIAYKHTGYELGSIKIYDIQNQKTYATNLGDYTWLDDGRLEIHGNCFFDNCGYYYSKSPEQPWEVAPLNDTAVYEKDGSIYYRNDTYTYAIARAYNDSANELEAYRYERPSLSPSKKFILFYKQGHEGPAIPFIYVAPDILGFGDYEGSSIPLKWKEDSNKCLGNIGTFYDAAWLKNDQIQLIQKNPTCGPYVTKKNTSYPWELEKTNSN